MRWVEQRAVSGFRGSRKSHSVCSSGYAAERCADAVKNTVSESGKLWLRSGRAANLLFVL